jgi:hypothetical protein
VSKPKSEIFQKGVHKLRKKLGERYYPFLHTSITYKDDLLRIMSKDNEISHLGKRLAKDDVIAEIDIGSVKLSEAYKLAAIYVVNTCCLAHTPVLNLGVGDIASEIFANMEGPKIRNVEVRNSDMFLVRNINSCFDEIDICLTTRRLLQTSQNRQLSHYAGVAFLNNKPTFSMVAKVSAKLNTDNKPITMPENILKFTYHWTMKECRLEKARICPDLSCKAIDSANLKSGSTIGIDVFADHDPSIRKKGFYERIVRKFAKWVVAQLAAGEDIHELLGWKAKVFFTKAEAFIDEADMKMRIVGCDAMIQDLFNSLLYKPVHRHLSNCSWYGPGISWAGSGVLDLLSALSHPLSAYFQNIYPMNSKPLLRIDETLYVMLDESNQDNKYNTYRKMITALLFSMFYENTGPYAEAFFKLFEYDYTYEFITLTQGFAGNWKLGTGSVNSGHRNTGGHCTVNAKYVSTAVLSSLRIPVVNVRDKFYGDDTVLAMNTMYDEKLCTSGNEVPDKMIDNAKKYMNVDYKPSQSYIARPIDGHRDRFFSMVDKDCDIISKGVSFLQKYFVKVDSDGTILHPDSPTFHRLMHFRDSHTCFVKLSTPQSVNADWAPKLFLRLHAMIFDAGANSVVVNECVSLMHKLRIMVPNVVKAATYMGFTEDQLMRIPELAQLTIGEILDYDNPMLYAINKFHYDVYDSMKTSRNAYSLCYSDL